MTIPFIWFDITELKLAHSRCVNYSIFKLQELYFAAARLDGPFCLASARKLISEKKNTK